MRIVLIRHGFSQGNKEKRFSGQMNVPLDEAGRNQARCLGIYIPTEFSDIKSIYSSDLIRAYDTAKPIADALSLPVRIRRDLREVDVGCWEGMLIEDVKVKYPESFALYKENPGLSRFDGGESYIDVMQRGKRALDAIVAENAGGTVVIATHGGVIRTLRAALDKLPPEKIRDIPHVKNGSITVFDYDGGVPTWLQIGYTGHLTDHTTEE